MSTALAPPTIAAAEDEVFTIHGLSWDQYVAINDALGDQAGVEDPLPRWEFDVREPWLPP